MRYWVSLEREEGAAQGMVSKAVGIAGVGRERG